MNRVFVSYSRRNKTFAERLARDLDDAGLDVWVDWRQIQVGEFWQDEIFRGIKRSDILVISLSPDAVKSEWVQREVNTARDQGKIILPVMAVNAFAELQATENMRWLLDIQFINFEGRYEEGLVELLDNLPGRRPVGTFDVFDEEKIPNPFKGLEAFQQTDSHFFFGREALIQKSLTRLSEERSARFLAVVGASGSGKSSLVRAGVIPQIRAGAIKDSDHWRVVIFTPGEYPVNALAQRLSPLIPQQDTEDINTRLHGPHTNASAVVQAALEGAPTTACLLIVVDQFEEVFTRAGTAEREQFLKIIHHAVTEAGGRAYVLITMRADFFDRLSHFPQLAELFERENMVIVTEMSAAELLRSIEGPAQAVGLVYDKGLPQRIMEDVQSQPGSLPLLQYALKELYKRRQGKRLTTAAYEAIGGVKGALAQRAEQIYRQFAPSRQAIMRRLLLRLVEVRDTGEATRRKVDRRDLSFADVPDEALSDVLNLLTSADARLLIASREIKASTDETAPTVWIEVGHEALIREWERFNDWVADNIEGLRLSTEILQSAQDWQQANRDASYLLTGTRLARAEVWLQEADATRLQRDFVEASITQRQRQEAEKQAQIERELTLQRKATQRLRLFAVVLVLSLLIAVGAGLVTFNSLGEAQAAEATAQVARQNAEANERQVRSLALAANAERALSDNDTELAVMLVVEANLVAESPSAQAQRSLSEVSYAPGLSAVLTGAGGALRDGLFSPDRRHALASAGTTIYVWELATRELVRQFNNPDEGHNETINTLALSPDGSRLVTGGDDNRVVVWDFESGLVMARLEGHSGDVTRVTFHPDGSRFASAGEDALVIVWDANTFSPLGRFEGHTSSVRMLDYNRDGSLLLSAADNGQVILLNNGNSISRTINHPGSVWAAAFNNSGNRLALGASDGTIRMYDLMRDVVWTQNFHDNAVTDLAFTTNDQVLISASLDSGLIRWQADNGSIRGVFNGYTPTNALDLSANAQQMLTIGDDGLLRLWDLRNAQEIQRYIGHGNPPTTIAVYGPDDLTILSGSHDGTLRLWSTLNSLMIREFRGHTDRVVDVAMSSDGSIAVSASWDGTVRVWDVPTGAQLHQLTGHPVRVQTVALSADNRLAISGSVDGDVILWDVVEGQQLTGFSSAAEKGAAGHLSRVNDIAIRPDGQMAVSVSDDERIILWDLSDYSLDKAGAVLLALDLNERVRSVAFSPDGRRVVTGGSAGAVVLWDVQPDSAAFGSALRTFEGHTRPVFGVDFSPNGRFIVSGSLDGTLRLWEIENGFEMRRYDVRATGETAFINSVNFSRDGRSVVTGMTDASLREWRILVELQDLLAWTFANRFVRQPTCNERQLFDILPLCGEDGAVATRTPFPLPTATPLPESLILKVGDVVTVNTDRADTLNMRTEPSINPNNIRRRLPSGTLVTLLEGPVEAEGFTWWRIRTENDLEGWVVESVPEDNVQTLVP